MAQQLVQHGGARMADLHSAGAGAMGHSQAVGLKLKKPFIARKLLGGQPAGRQGQPRGGIRLNFPNQFLHSRLSLVANLWQGKRTTAQSTRSRGGLGLEAQGVDSPAERTDL